MLKSHWRVISFFERVSDNVVIVAAFVAAHQTRDDVIAVLNRFLPYPQQLNELGPLSAYMFLLFAAVPLFNILLSMLGAYRSMRFSSVKRLFKNSAIAAGVVFLSEGALLYLLKQDISRSFVAIFCVYAGISIFCIRIFVLRALRYWRVRGKNYRNLLVVGTGMQARRVFKEIASQPELGVKIQGFVRVRKSDADEQLYSEIADLPIEVVADCQSFEDALKKYEIDEVLFTDVAENLSSSRELVHVAIEEGIGITLAADLFSLELHNSELSYFGRIPLIHYSVTPSADFALATKRFFDVLLSSAGIIALSPIFLLIALVVKLESEGPVFFSQKRVGLNGRKFNFYKFRSMVIDAEKQIDSLRDQNEMNGPVFKIKNDPRITKVGSFIRKYSLDELPQLFNVLIGDMSLVGPRPPLPDEVKGYMRKQRRRLSMRPGMTCIWQVSGRNDIPDFETWAKLDLEYIDNWSLLKDLSLLVRTIPAVLSGEGR